MTKYDGKCLHGAGPGSPGDCTNDRWTHPEKGLLCLCEEHAISVLEGHEKAPPLRMTFDYVSTGRRSFLVDGTGATVTALKHETLAEALDELGKLGGKLGDLT